ncbi:N-acetylmuramoyl-L-alanine amidase [Streptomyces caeni]|uniref:N-acetylmuramoyl-L-alanine amidase n=1 Tax=Streptomyces caeni TaxID=2307231 RepID=A0ABW4IK41_9ACTN
MAVPLTADQLVAALLAEGVTVDEVLNWRTNNRDAVGAWGPVNGVVIHHTVTGPGDDVVGIVYNGDSSLPGPWAHGCITKDGTVHLVGNGRANHAGGGDQAVLDAVIAESYADYPPPPTEHEGSPGAVDGNARFYGFECENLGDGRDPWPLVQYAAMVRATAAVCRAHGWGPKSAIGHLEWSDWKSDPRGFPMAGFRQDLADCLALPPGRWRVVRVRMTAAPSTTGRTLAWDEG